MKIYNPLILGVLVGACTLGLVNSSMATQNFNVIATADNQYELYVGTPTSATTDVGGAFNTTAGQIFVPETYSLSAPDSSYIYVAAWSDIFDKQGFLASFQNLTLGGFVRSGDPQWQVTATGVSLANGAAAPTLADLTTQIQLANASTNTSNGWVAPAVYSIDNGGGGPYGVTVGSGMGNASQWMWWNGPTPYTNPDNAFTDGQDHGEYLIFRLPVTAVPEPSTIVLLGLGTIGIGAKLWRRRRINRTGGLGQSTDTGLATAYIRLPTLQS
ncbi:MAG TPA: PEP-CTERM sorting domain-containing protein [Pirellulales bacterium]|nr:PEP-CTERM sorting domain-containing protein [Pirellulales bacterium]